MAVMKIEKNKQFIKRGDKMTEFYWIVQGSVRQVLQNEEIILEKGSMIGIAECTTGLFACDYITNEECVLYGYEYEKEEDFHTIFQSQLKNQAVFFLASTKTADIILKKYAEYMDLSRDLFQYSSEMYRQYQIICMKLKFAEKSFSRMEYFEPLYIEKKLRNSKINYFASLAKIPLSAVEEFYAKDEALVVGEIIYASETVQRAVELIEEVKQYLQENQDILLNDKKNDLFSLYFELQIKAASKEMEQTLFKNKMKNIMEFIRKTNLYDEDMIQERFATYESFDFTSVPTGQDVEKALTEEAQVELEEPPIGDEWFEFILNYASYDEEKMKRLKKMVFTFRDTADIFSTADDVYRLRREIAKEFYDLYIRVCKRSLHAKTIPNIIKMFLNFGFLDVQLAGEENTRSLYELCNHLENCNSEHVYTIYEWLKSIYDGKNEPSKNEFDLDYSSSLREQKRMGEITDKDEERLKNDNWSKVVYEIENMFRSTNRATYGRITAFCPVINEFDLINPPEKMLLTVEKITNAINQIKSIDFSAFYQEIIFSDTEHGVPKEMIQKEVLPDVILMPNAGSKSMMWQETAGSKRDTPARFIMPVLTVADEYEMMVELTGRYRWEICRKIQGMRWNDITERSLTSEYCDYLQFFKKNHDLSQETRESVRLALVKAKNNYREVFVRDYLNWIRFEALGSFRLNKVAREILFHYCPFSKELRAKMGTYPLIQPINEKYEVLKAKKMRHISNVYDKYEKSGGEITPQLQENLDFYEL